MHDIWEKIDETTLPPKKDFYSELNLKGISDEDYAHAQKVWEVFEIVAANIMTNMFKVTHYCLQMYLKMLEMCLDIYRLGPVYFVSAPALAWQTCLKKTGVKLELLTDYDMILMIEKGIGVVFAKQHIGMLKQMINI